VSIGVTARSSNPGDRGRTGFNIGIRYLVCGSRQLMSNAKRSERLKVSSVPMLSTDVPMLCAPRALNSISAGERMAAAVCTDIREGLCMLLIKL